MSALLLTFLAAVAAAHQDLNPDFNQDVRPILSDKCFACHGPDEAQRKADLRFDVVDVALSKGVIVPGDPEASPLAKRIRSSDPDFQMPPPDSNRSLDDGEIETLVAWIASGARFERHWSFKPIADPRPPEGYLHPIDAFVQTRLGDEGLEASPTARPETLARRLSFDLTGLPPNEDFLDRILLDSSPDAYEKVVDDWMATPAFGERMALMWLDVARYADTFGYQSDRENHVWPWREWVIRAFNENLPFDSFIEWQVAGDLFPNATHDQVLATTFNRLHRQTNEGGSVLEEFRLEYVSDRTNTFATAFLGLTMECAQCHDHKFDAISQRDYYSLSSFFNNIDESGMYSHFTEVTPSPSLLLADDDDRERIQLQRMLVEEREKAIDALRSEDREGRIAEWMVLGKAVVVPDPVVRVSFDEIEERKTPVESEDESVATLVLNPLSVEGPRGQALLFSGDNSVEISKAGIFERSDSFSIAAWLKVPDAMKRGVIVHRSMAAEDAANRGYELLIHDGRLDFALCHFWPGNALRVRSLEPVPTNEWFHLTLSYDGSSRAQGIRIYLDGRSLGLEVVRDALSRTIQYSPGGDSPPLVIGSRFRDTGFKGGQVDEFLVFDRALTAVEATLLCGDSGENLLSKEAWADHYWSRVDEDYAAAREGLTRARIELAKSVDATRAIMVMREMDMPRETRILARGRYDAPGKTVRPDTPAAVLPYPDDLPRNRLGLAKWLTDPKNPLTARVAVNRFWQIFFGRGLVETQEDFGSQGQPPSHPELLDHLASWFVASGWDVKALCRYIVTSDTYRQTSECSPALRSRDPFNVLLARGPRHRLSAEEIRDAALAASGLLVSTIGGASVRPYQPPGLWKEAGSLTYKADSGEGLYRRSMYTFWKRTVPPPAMLIFDAPSRETCVVRRERTATPLQSLVLLNSTQFVEAARRLAERALSICDATEDRIDWICRRLLARSPSVAERAILLRAFDEQSEAFDEADTAWYVSLGGHGRDRDADAVAHAALTAVAQLLMNFDEFVMKS